MTPGLVQCLGQCEVGVVVHLGHEGVDTVLLGDERVAGEGHAPEGHRRVEVRDLATGVLEGVRRLDRRSARGRGDAVAEGGELRGAVLLEELPRESVFTGYFGSTLPSSAANMFV